MKYHEVFFLIAGLIILGFGYQITASSSDELLNSKWWGFGATLLGGLILGKWLSDHSIEKKKRK